ncbi:MAG TPA: VOC family protein [Bacteroidales bacterium]|nr:VOC family protein [Bacteroidales bacterium]
MKNMVISLNFNGFTEEAFNFYKKVFKTEFRMMQYFKDMPPMEGFPPVPDSLKNKVLHVELPIGGNAMLFGSDSLPEMGRGTTAGDNFAISLDASSKEEADALFNGLAEGGKAEMPMAMMFWGAYHGMLTDRFGIRWTISFQ